MELCLMLTVGWNGIQLVAGHQGQCLLNKRETIKCTRNGGICSLEKMAMLCQ